MQITVDFPIIADPTREISVKCALILVSNGATSCERGPLCSGFGTSALFWASPCCCSQMRHTPPAAHVMSGSNQWYTMNCRLLCADARRTCFINGI